VATTNMGGLAEAKADGGSMFYLNLSFVILFLAWGMFKNIKWLSIIS